jgi:hypothetical protein
MAVLEITRLERSDQEDHAAKPWDSYLATRRVVRG